VQLYAFATFGAWSIKIRRTLAAQMDIAIVIDSWFIHEIVNKSRIKVK
jgi:hypothetical protein